MFTSLNRVTYCVQNITEAKEWYSRVLNSSPLFESPFAVVFAVGTYTLVLSPQSETTTFGSSAVPYWSVENIDDSMERLTSMGASVVSDIRTVMNQSMATVQDPFGNHIGISSLNTTARENRVEQQSSESAMTVTYCRALASYDNRESLRGDDSFAELFLSEEFKLSLASEESRQWARKKLGDYYGYMISRTSYGDALFKKALEDRVDQIVLLGTGFDSRSLRFKECITDTKIFEVDIITTQSKKGEILQTLPR